MIFNPARAVELFNREICLVETDADKLFNGILLLELRGNGVKLSCSRKENDGLLLRL